MSYARAEVGRQIAPARQLIDAGSDKLVQVANKKSVSTNTNQSQQHQAEDKVIEGIKDFLKFLLAWVLGFTCAPPVRNHHRPYRWTLPIHLPA